jgi:hypothetical protein
MASLHPVAALFVYFAQNTHQFCIELTKYHRFTTFVMDKSPIIRYDTLIKMRQLSANK